MSLAASPSGPISAVFLVVEIGSTWPWFLSSTTERPAALRAAARFSGLSILPGAAATSTYGFSNSPARNLIRRIRRTASSMRFIETWPRATRSRP